jgi:hypothetical protein
MINPDIRMDDGRLCCPNCSDTYLHHKEVMIFSRQREDGEVTISLIHGAGSSGGVHVLPYGGNRNPSARRDGIAVIFCCEGCDAKIELTIAQHKGETEMQWREAMI